jgi:hypothetical protein
MLKLKFLMLIMASSVLSALLTSRTGLTEEALSLQDQRINLDELMIGCSVIDPLDKCIQERFKKIDGRFGLARIRTPSTLHEDSYFKPETTEEGQLIQDLECDGWQVAFYLAGRRVLGPDHIKIGDHTIGIRTIDGPISFTAPHHHDSDKLTEMLKLPKHQQLKDHVKSAMVEFDKTDRYDFAIGKWMFAARPIRAQENCLKCHISSGMALEYWRTVNPNHTRDKAPGEPPLKVGDPLGAAIYAIARARNNN